MYRQTRELVIFKNDFPEYFQNMISMLNRAHFFLLGKEISVISQSFLYCRDGQ